MSGILELTSSGLNRRENPLHARRNQPQNNNNRGPEESEEAGEHTRRRTIVRSDVGRPRDRLTSRLRIQPEPRSRCHFQRESCGRRL